jgi:cytochrome c oxidase subunit II
MLTRPLLLAVAILGFAILTALAQATTPSPSTNTAPITNWLQDPASALAFDVRSNFWTAALLTLPFLLLPEILLLIIIWKFRESRGHAPATFHENWRLEVAWTVVPVLTLITIAIPTYATLHKIDAPPKSDLVVEVIGHQFFWEYRYPRYGVDIANEPLVVPAERVVTINTTSVDVVHSWWVPAFALKQDANPGRIGHSWFKARAGRYKGQCAELCGPQHGQMFIDVTVVPPDEFEHWIKSRIPPDDAADPTATTKPADSTAKPADSTGGKKTVKPVTTPAATNKGS